MAKLYFRHGVVSSAKTLNLLACAHSYKIQGKRVLVIKPAMDTRFGAGKVKSRAGLDRDADILVEPSTVFAEGTFVGADCVLVDEAQFVSPAIIEQLRDVATKLHVPVICYGLRTDFRSRLFPASKRLMELADVIEDVKTTCTFCNRRAILNLKSVDDKPTLTGPTVCLGCEELYVPACYQHFCEKIEEASGKPLDFDWAAKEGARADAEQAAAKGSPSGKGKDISDDDQAPEVTDKIRGSKSKAPRDSCEPESEQTPEKVRRVAVDNLPRLSMMFEV